MSLTYLCSGTFTLYAQLSTQFLSGFVQLYKSQFTLVLLRNRDKVVNIATGLRAGRIGDRIPVRARDLSTFPKRTDGSASTLSLMFNGYAGEAPGA